MDDLAEACVMLASQNDATYAKQLGAWRNPLINECFSKMGTQTSSVAPR